jgi:hypothetical protein
MEIKALEMILFFPIFWYQNFGNFFHIIRKTSWIRLEKNKIPIFFQKNDKICPSKNLCLE